MATELTHDEIAELLGAYALDAVVGEEREQVEAHLAICPRCASEVRDHREVAALLGHGGAAAPDGLWDRIAASLEEEPPKLALAPVTRPVGHRLIDLRWAAPLVAAAAVVIALLGATAVRQEQRINRITEDAAADGLVRAYNSALTDPAAEVVDLRSDDGELVVTAALQPDGRGFLSGENLPVLTDGRTYQLWGQVNGVTVSLGVLGDDPDVVAFESAGDMEALMITDEAAPVVVSQQPPVVLGELA